jgi:hypothetical protein
VGGGVVGAGRETVVGGRGAVVAVAWWTVVGVAGAAGTGLAPDVAAAALTANQTPATP